MTNLNRDGINIHYEVHGTGPVILLSHGYSATSEMWRGQIEPLSREHTLLLWDMRGHGLSDYPVDPAAYSEAATVADMAALLDAVGARSGIVGGLSLGGYMSLAFHKAYPERVKALLIIDTGPGYRSDQARAEWNLFALDRAERLDKEGLAALNVASAEVMASRHRSAQGLVFAARGMLTQHNAGVIDAAEHLRPHDCDRRRQRQALPKRCRLHGEENSEGRKGHNPRRRPRGEPRPARRL
jgi:pimeloyl-ACP methyl ester carboxylesterase